MNYLNVLNTEVKESRIEECLEALLLRDMNNVETILKAKMNKNIEIDLSKEIYKTTRYLNMIQVMARLGYSAGSEVGLIIVALSVGDTLKDMELNKQFLIKGTNKVDMFKMKKVFKDIGRGVKSGYDRVFTDNMFLDITDVLGRKTFILLALKKHVQEFIDQIASIGELYQEDLVKIGKDLGIIATVVSEIEIDSAKKPELKENLPEVSSYMAQNMNLRSRKLSMRHNFKEIKDCFKNPNRNENINFESCIAEEGMIPLFKFDEEWEAMYNSIINSEYYQVSDEKEQHKIVMKAKYNLLKQCYIVDPLSEFAQALHDQQVENLNTLVELYKTSSNNIFNFDLGLTGDKAKAADQLRYVTVKVINMINYIFANKKDMSLPNLEEACIDYRNMLYTYGEKLGLAPEETFCVCADAGWWRIFIDKQTGKEVFNKKKNNYSFKAMEMLFGNELKYFFNDEVMRKEVDIELPPEIFAIKDAVYHGMKLEFVDGEALVHSSEEHGELYAFRNDVDDYTGSVVIEVSEEGYLIFREEFQAFNFDRVEFIIFDAITDSTNKTETLMNQEIIASLKQASLANNIDAFEYKFDRCRLDQNVLDNHADSIGAFNNYIALASKSSAETQFEVFVKGKGYAYLLQDRKIGRMMGHMLYSHTQTKISEAKVVKAHTTGVGSIIIIKK